MKDELYARKCHVCDEMTDNPESVCPDCRNDLGIDTEIEFECETCFDTGVVTVRPDMDGVTRHYPCNCKEGERYAIEYNEEDEDK